MSFQNYLFRYLGHRNLVYQILRELIFLRLFPFSCLVGKFFLYFFALRSPEHPVNCLAKFFEKFLNFKQEYHKAC